MGKKQRIDELQHEVLVRAAQIESLERQLADKESVLDYYRECYSELVGRVDALTGVVNKKLTASTPAKKASAPPKRASSR